MNCDPFAIELHARAPVCIEALVGTPTGASASLRQLDTERPTLGRSTTRRCVMRSRAAVAGHPVHPALVGFPVTCYVGTLVAFALYAEIGTQFWLNLAILFAIGGVGSAAIAALPGIVDLALAVPRGTATKLVGVAHALGNVAALGLFAAILPSYVTHWDGPPADTTLGLALSSAGVLVTLVAGTLGWRLVQTHHVGVQLTAVQEVDEATVQRLPLRLHRRRAA
jgi:uncharacterized membrane protein